MTAIGALWIRRYRLARVAAATQVSLILWGWALAQYPYVVPPALTIAEAGALVLFPSLAYLFRVFKRQPTAA